MNPDGIRILVVDDESQISLTLQTLLTANGYTVRCAADGFPALEIFREWNPHLVITDLAMPKMNGIVLCEKIRAWSNTPIIVLSVKQEEATKVEALEHGADDYVTKPFGMDELLARVRATLRRSPAATSEASILEEGDFRMNLSAHRVEIKDQEVYLTPKEFQLLEFLLRNEGKLLTHKTLLLAIWGEVYVDQLDTIRVLVRQLRRKIETNPAVPQYLKTEPWIGYRFEPSK